MLSYPEITFAICWSSSSREERMITCLFLFFLVRQNESYLSPNLCFEVHYSMSGKNNLSAVPESDLNSYLTDYFLHSPWLLAPFCMSSEDCMCRYVIWDPRTEVFCLSLKGYRTFEAKTLRLWNNLLDEIRSDESMSSFKSLLKTYLYQGECPDFICVSWSHLYPRFSLWILHKRY